MKSLSAVLLLALGSVFSFVPASSMVSRDAGIRGKITKIQRAADEDEKHFVGTLLVEADEKDANPDKAHLIVNRDTRILRERGGERLSATFEDFAVGQTVETRFVEGPTIMIYPLRVAASEIVILNTGDEKEKRRDG